jgi:hypothetical protein
MHAPCSCRSCSTTAATSGDVRSLTPDPWTAAAAGGTPRRDVKESGGGRFALDRALPGTGPAGAELSPEEDAGPAGVVGADEKPDR